MLGPSREDASGISAGDALAQAVAALTAGRHDGRLPDGAQANALESIAWALIGILQAQTTQTKATGSATRSLSDDLRKAGFLQIDPQPE